MQEIFKQYQSEVSSEPVDLREVGAWAIKNRLWAPRPVDIQSRFASEMAEARERSTEQIKPAVVTDQS